MRKTLVILIVAAAASALLGISIVSYVKQVKFREKRDRAIASFRRSISGAEERDALRTDRYLDVKSQKRAITMLENKRSLRDPVVVAASFGSSVDRGYYRPACRIVWCEDGFATEGLVVVAHDGQRWEFSRFVWDERDEELLKGSIIRAVFLPVVIKGGELWDDPSVMEDCLEPIELPIEIFGDSIRVGLFTKEGYYTELVDAYIDSDFLDRDPCATESKPDPAGVGPLGG